MRTQEGVAASAPRAAAEAIDAFVSAMRFTGVGDDGLAVHRKGVEGFAEFMAPRCLDEATDSDARAFLAYLGELGVTATSLRAYAAILARFTEYQRARREMSAPRAAASSPAPGSPTQPSVAAQAPASVRATASAAPAAGAVAMPKTVASPWSLEGTEGLPPTPSTPDLEPVARARAWAVEEEMEDAASDDPEVTAPVREAVPLPPPRIPPASAHAAERLAAPAAAAVDAEGAVAPRSSAADVEEERRLVASEDEQVINSGFIPLAPHAVPLVALALPQPTAMSGWSVRGGGVDWTELELAELRNMARDGRLRPTDMIRKGRGPWMRAEKYPPLARIFMPTASTTSPEVAIVRRAGGGAAMRALFGVALGACLGGCVAWLADVVLGVDVPAAWIAGSIVAGVACGTGLRDQSRVVVGLAAVGATLVSVPWGRLLLRETIVSGAAGKGLGASASLATVLPQPVHGNWECIVASALVAFAVGCLRRGR